MNDNDLRDRFRVLQSEVERTAPPYRRPANRPARVRLAPAWLAAAALATLVAGAVWIATRNGTPPPQTLVGLDATWWVTPTDFLLTTPGTDLLRSVPTLGVTEGAADDASQAVNDTAELTERTRS
jgi:hypothetical protein